MRHATRAANSQGTPFIGDESQGSGSGSGDESSGGGADGDLGEDIEGAEFAIESESSDGETSQDRAMIDDAPQSLENPNPLVQYAQFNAALGSGSESEGLGELLGRRFKRRAPGEATHSVQSRRRARVLESSDSSADEGSPQQGRSPGTDVQAASAVRPSPTDHPMPAAPPWSADKGSPPRRGSPPADVPPTFEVRPSPTDHPMPDASPQSNYSAPRWLDSGPPPELDDDCWFDDGEFDRTFEDDFFNRCLIVSRPLRACSRVTPPPTTTSAAANPGPFVRESGAPTVSASSAYAPHGSAGDQPGRFPPPSPTAQATPSPAAQTPPFSAPPPIDPCLAAARHFHGLGVATVLHDLFEKRFPNGQIRKSPCRWASGRKPWNEATLGNCLEEFVGRGRNSISIVAEASDIYGVDVDVKDGGFEALEQMLEEHGPFPEDTPRLTTGNGGLHILFSLSQTEQAGLLNCGNRERIHYKGKEVGIDTRGNGGMLHTAPSSYIGVDGRRRSYVWDHEILPGRANLRAAPAWLISIFNDIEHRPDGSGGEPARASGGSNPEHAPFDHPLPVENPHAVPPAAVLGRVKACVAATGDTASRFDRLKADTNGSLYVFRVVGPRRCPHGNHHDGSNNFCVLVRGRSLLYVCNSAECRGICPLPKIGELTCSEAMIGGKTCAFCADDLSAVNILSKRFVDYWPLKGTLEAARLLLRCTRAAASGYHVVLWLQRLRFDGKFWFYWDSRRFVPDEPSDFVVEGVLINQLRVVYMRVREELNAAIEATTDPESRGVLVERLKRLRTYNNSSDISRTVKLLRHELFDRNFVEQLDANPDILNVKNGVLLLKTGELDQHRPHYMCSKIAETDYMGIEYPTPRVDAFLADIFNHDARLVDYVRMLYGYALNGHTREEIFLLLLGGGSNGKGVFKQMLQDAVGSYYCTMSKDAVVTAPGQKPSSKNAPSDHIFALMGARLAVTDETNEDERVDLGLVLGMTGGGSTVARPMYGKPVEFRITHTPFVQTNYPPAIGGKAIKENIVRRLRVIPFPNEYVHSSRFDPTNATHRLKDESLKALMSEEESRRQTLSWIARGSAEWYASADGLGEPPEAVQSATSEYLREADKLQLFIEQHCEIKDGVSTLQTDFAGFYRQFSSENISYEKLAERMGKKGFKRAKNNGTPRQFYYPDILCTYAV